MLTKASESVVGVVKKLKSGSKPIKSLPSLSNTREALGLKKNK